MLWLDGDGTLVPIEFAKWVWYDEVPRRVSEKLDIPHDHARKLCKNWYKFMDLKLAWYDSDFWEDLLGVRIGDLYRPVEPFSDALQVLEDYEGDRYLVTGVVSKYARIQFSKVLSHFHGMITPDMIRRHKADPEFYTRACQFIGCNPRDVVFVDDVPEFVMAAREAGIEAYLIDRENKKKFDGKITSLMDLLRLLH